MNDTNENPEVTAEAKPDDTEVKEQEISDDKTEEIEEVEGGCCGGCA